MKRISRGIIICALVCLLFSSAKCPREDFDGIYHHGINKWLANKEICNDKGLVEDTFQIGRHVVGISLPERSKIYIGKKPMSENGDRVGTIFLDTLILEKLKKKGSRYSIDSNLYIYISDISLASCCGLSSEPDDVIRVLKSDTLQNTFVIRVLKTADRYNVRAASPNYGMSFEIDVDSLNSVDSMIKIYKTIRILPMRKYDNTKSDRPKGVINVRLE
ncbi:MAG: hypothetical protein Q4F07_01785 [Bacteroidales bacterium]|nr:hypothetical protein [Bacteroidales bacterium]